MDCKEIEIQERLLKIEHQTECFVAKFRFRLRQENIP